MINRTGYVRRTVRAKTLNVASGSQRFTLPSRQSSLNLPRPNYLQHLVKGLRFAGWFDEARTLEGRNLG